MTRPLVFVTGGSRGIGAATCRMAAARGYDVAIGYARDRASAEAVAADCRAAGARAGIFGGDMAVEAEIERVFADIDGALGRISHFVNNAGVTGKTGRLDETATEVVRAAMEINVFGAILAARAAIRRISRRHGGPGGAIVNVSSMAATLGSPGEYVWYAATKGAIDALTVGLSKELAAEGVRVNAVSPGLIETEIHAVSSAAPDRLARLGPLSPLGRAGTAEEVAEAILFLLSEAASYTTGANLRISGGR